MLETQGRGTGRQHIQREVREMRFPLFSEEVLFSGKQCARKRASTVWGRAVRKGPRGTSLAASSTSLPP
jgi:hypothetical protein